MRVRLALAGLPDRPIQHKWSCFDHFIGQIQTLYSLFARSTCSEGPFELSQQVFPYRIRAGRGNPVGPQTPGWHPGVKVLLTGGTGSSQNSGSGFAVLAAQNLTILAVRLDSPAGREHSGGVAGVSLELGRRAAPQGQGVQWRTRGIASTSGGDSIGG